MAVCMERFGVKPSSIDPSLYGVYDFLEQHYVVAYVNGKDSEDSYRRAWEHKEQIDREHEEQRKGGK